MTETAGAIYFNVTVPGGNIIEFASKDNPRYTIEDNGVLNVTTNRAGVQIFGPSGWWHIDVRAMD